MKANIVTQSRQLSPEIAESVIEKARRKANELGIALSFSIVDNGGHLFVFKRLPKAMIASIDLSIRKARTAALFGIGTDILGQLSKENGPLYGIERAIDGLISFPGGLVIRHELGESLGAIGISGGTFDQDSDVARAALSYQQEDKRK